MIGRDRNGCSGSTRVAIVVPTASCTVELEPRGASIRGSLWIVPDLVENAQNAFPTRSLDAQTASTTLHRRTHCFDQEKTKAVK
jgi:hypothetical protein